jgi:hypothetical protein
LLSQITAFTFYKNTKAKLQITEIKTVLAQIYNGKEN